MKHEVRNMPIQAIKENNEDIGFYYSIDSTGMPIIFRHLGVCRLKAISNQMC